MHNGVLFDQWQRNIGIAGWSCLYVCGAPLQCNRVSLRIVDENRIVPPLFYFDLTISELDMQELSKLTTDSILILNIYSNFKQYFCEFGTFCWLALSTSRTGVRRSQRS